MRQDDPSQELAAPKEWHHLPDHLNEGEVEALLNTPDTRTPKGLRDRTILEILYGTGMRVSELTGLKLEWLHLEGRVFEGVGKGI